MGSSSMADMLTLGSTSNPMSCPFNWLVTVKASGLASLDVMLHWSVVASINSQGACSGAWTLGDGFPHIRRNYILGDEEGSGNEFTGSGSHSAEAQGIDGEGPGGGSCLISDSHPAEVPGCSVEGPGANLTICVLSESAIISATALTITPVQHTGLLNRVVSVVSCFLWRFLDFIFSFSLWGELVPSERATMSGLAFFHPGFLVTRSQSGQRLRC